MSSMIVALSSLAISATAETSRVRGPHVRSDEPASIRITVTDLHAQGGVPRGWTFAVPTADVAEGRKVPAAMECFRCHEVKGENFLRPRRRREA